MTNEEKAIELYPYETETDCHDEFTCNYRNSIIDLFRKCFVAGCEYKEKEINHELDFIKVS